MPFDRSRLKPVSGFDSSKLKPVSQNNLSGTDSHIGVTTQPIQPQSQNIPTAPTPYGMIGDIAMSGVKQTAQGLMNIGNFFGAGIDQAAGAITKGITGKDPYEKQRGFDNATYKAVDTAQESLNQAEIFKAKSMPQWSADLLGSLAAWYLPGAAINKAGKALKSIPYIGGALQLGADVLGFGAMSGLTSGGTAEERKNSAMEAAIFTGALGLGGKLLKGTGELAKSTGISLVKREFIPKGQQGLEAVKRYARGAKYVTEDIGMETNPTGTDYRAVMKDIMKYVGVNFDNTEGTYNKVVTDMIPLQKQKKGIINAMTEVGVVHNASDLFSKFSANAVKYSNKAPDTVLARASMQQAWDDFLVKAKEIGVDFQKSPRITPSQINQLEDVLSQVYKGISENKDPNAFNAGKKFLSDYLRGSLNNLAQTNGYGNQLTKLNRQLQMMHIAKDGLDQALGRDLMNVNDYVISKGMLGGGVGSGNAPLAVYGAARSILKFQRARNGVGSLLYKAGNLLKGLGELTDPTSAFDKIDDFVNSNPSIKGAIEHAIQNGGNPESAASILIKAADDIQSGAMLKNIEKIIQDYPKMEGKYAKEAVLSKNQFPNISPNFEMVGPQKMLPAPKPKYPKVPNGPTLPLREEPRLLNAPSSIQQGGYQGKTGKIKVSLTGSKKDIRER